jgi:YceI-like domain
VKIPPGVYQLGPDDGRLTVHTQRSGAAAMAGHNLVIDVTSWRAMLTAGETPAEMRVELDVDGGSLRVREGTGGMQTLERQHKQEIEQTIDDEVLRRDAISFRSTGAAASPDGDAVTVEGELTLRGTSRPIAFDVSAEDDGTVSASTVIKQTDYGIKPYSTLFGALRVVDEVEVSIAVRLPSPVAGSAA